MQTRKALRSLLDMQTHLAKSLVKDLDAACKVIRRVEAERDELKAENQRLRNHPAFQRVHFDAVNVRETAAMNAATEDSVLSGSVDVIVPIRTPKDSA